MDEILKYSLDVGAASTALDFVNAAKLSNNDRAFMDAEYSYFSPLWLSRDNDGGSRFMFAFNMRSYIRNNSIFGNLLNRESPSVKMPTGHTKEYWPRKNHCGGAASRLSGAASAW